MRHRHLWKKIISTVIFVTALNTACGIDFSGGHHIDSSLIEKISVSIDNTDFRNEEEVCELADALSSEDYGDCNFEKALLVRIVDGDTLVVSIDNEEYKVRLIGINTPESVASKEYLEYKGTTNSEEGKEASKWVKEYLKDVDKIYLSCDKQDIDKYGRLLRYVWLEVPEDAMDIEEVQTKMLNAILLKENIAEVTIYKPNVEYADMFQAIYTQNTDLYEIDR